MKKILSFAIPLVCALFIIGLGFRIGSPSQTVTDPEDDTLLDEFIGQETVSVPDIFHGVGSPKKTDAIAFLQTFEAPGYTLLDASQLYGSISGMSVYGFFPGEELTEEAVWNDNAVIEVFLFADPEAPADALVENMALRLSPRNCGEEECKKLIDYAEEILRFSVPNMTPAEFELLLSTDGYKALMKRCRSYSDPESVLQPGSAVNEVFVAGEESLTMISHDVYQYVEITLYTPTGS